MKFIYSCQTDIGTVRSSNQDSLIVKAVRFGQHRALLAAVCDGVGGLSYGELTSRRAADMLAMWADYELSQIFKQERIVETLKHRFQQLILDINREVFYSNQRNRISSGTTLTALLLWDYQYLIGHVGDSRIYRVIENQACQLTPDHSWVAQAVETGQMTKEQALIDPRRNLILKCIGAKEEVKPYFATGDVFISTVFILCTDGFWHYVKEAEWQQSFSPIKVTCEHWLSERLCTMIEQVKRRGEQDNITAVAIKVH